MLAVFDVVNDIALIPYTAMKAVVDWVQQDNVISVVDNYFLLVGVTLLLIVAWLVGVVRVLRPRDKRSRGWVGAFALFFIVAPFSILSILATIVRYTGMPF